MTQLDTPPAFQAHYRSTVHDLRSAIAEALSMAGADPAAPQDMARDLGINRNLTWKLSRLIAAQDLEAAFPKVPGLGATKILLQALAKAGVSAEQLGAISSASTAFESMVVRHAGDRATMELMLDSSSAAHGEPLELSRKLAFQGNSGIWGCQARVRMRAIFLAPSESDPSQLDCAQTSGLIDLVRFRPDAVWPFFRRTSFADDGTPLEHAPEHRVAFDERAAEAGPALLRHYCSQELPEVRVERHPTGFTYSLGPSPVGNSAKMTIIYGAGMRCFAPRYRDAKNTWAESFLPVNAPAESLLMDFYIHRDMRDEVRLEPKLLLGGSEASFQRHSVELAVTEPVRDLGAGPPLSSTSLMPRHGELVGDVFAHMGWSANDFQGFRLELKHPPTPSTALLRYRLPESPGPPDA